MQPLITMQPILTTQQVPILIIKDSDVVKQLKKTKVEINVWKLLATSREYRVVVMDALAKVGIDSKTTPEGLAKLPYE